MPAPAASASSGGTVTYTANVNIPAPPASSFAGASSGDGWAVALTPTAVYNVFHHQEYLGVDCHLQANAAQTAPCWGGQVTITDTDGSAFYTEGQPGLYLNQSTGDLYVFVEHPEDDTVGVACINTNATLPASNIFCGYTPLTPSGQGPPNGSGISGVSNPVQVGSNWYAFNYVNGTPTGGEDKLLCFSLTTFSACSNEPYAVSTGLSSYSVDTFPAPSIAAFDGQIEIPVADGGATTLGCYEPSVAGGSCGGSWPISTGIDYEGNWGAAFPMLNSAGATTGFCIPDGSNPCWTLSGATASTPSGLTSSTMPADSVWNGPATTVGPRVYVPNGNYNAVYCFDWSQDAECSNFPKDFSNLGLLYTVNPDPQRPTCFWVNSDNGSSQIQNFDAFSAGVCGTGPIVLQASNFVAPPEQCTPTQWTDLQITNPSPPTVYGGGSVEFENDDGTELSGTGGSNPATLDSTGSVNLSPYNFSAAEDLPDFALTLNSPPSDLSSVTVQVSWQASGSSSCTVSGTSVSGSVSLSAPAAGAPIDTNQTLTATLLSGGSALSGADVTFTCVSGPCTTPSGSGTTNSQGIATLTYSSTIAGDDIWQASYTPSGQQTETSDAAVVWNFIASAAPSQTSYGNDVTLSESGLPATATGTVTFSAGGSTLCTVTLTGLAGEATSCQTGVLALGSYSVTATYSGDANDPASSATTSFAIGQSSTQTTASITDVHTGQLWSNHEEPGAVANDAAFVTNATSGTVTYNLYSGDNCLGPLLQANTEAVGISGTATPSPDSSPLAAGSYSYQAVYNGTSQYTSSNGPCQPFSVEQASTSPELVAVDANDDSAWGSSEGLGTEASASVDLTTPSDSNAGAPPATGTVTYTFFDNGTCTGSPTTTAPTTIADGSVDNAPATGALAAGTYSYKASYSGDSNYEASTSGCVALTVAEDTPGVTVNVLDAGTGNSWAGTEVTGASANASSSLGGVEGFTPGDTVTYEFYAGSACTGTPILTDEESLVDGSPANSADTSALGAGTYSVQADYSGDANYTAASSSCAQFTVNEEQPALSAAVEIAPSEQTGAQVYDTATLTGVEGFTPTGTVTYTFYDNGTCTGDGTTQTVDLSDGSVPNSSTSSPLGAGDYGFEVTYSGDDNYQSVSYGCQSFSFGQGSPIVSEQIDDSGTSSPWSGQETIGAAATDTSTVMGLDGITPTGSVTYELFDNATCDGTPASSTSSDLVAGTVPDGPSTGPLAAGTYGFEAVYSGDSNYAPLATACGSFTVAPATPSVGVTVLDAGTSEAWAGTEVTGAAANASSSVSGVEGFTPTASVTYEFYSGPSCTGTPILTDDESIVDGSPASSVATANLGAGTYSAEADYSGDANYNAASSACASFTVDKAQPTLSGEVVFSGVEKTGAEVYDTATLSGVEGFTDTGTVAYRFFDNGTCSGEAPGQTVTLSDGDVPSSATSAPLPAGSYSFEAVYSGDANYLSADGGCQSFSFGTATPQVGQAVDDAATGTAWSGHETLGASAVDTATVAGVAGITPTGSVNYELFDNGTCSGTPASHDEIALADGSVANAPATAKLAVGTYGYQAVYSGDSNYAASATSCKSFSVLPGASSTTESVHDASTKAAWSGSEVQGISAYDTAKVAGIAGFVPSGSLTYSLYDNHTCTGPVRSSQTVKLSGGKVPNSSKSSELAPGWYSYRAVYSGSAEYRSSSRCGAFLVQATGYRLEGGDGGVFDFHSHFRGSVPRLGLHIYNFVGMAAMTNGYWLVESDGGIYAFGTAHNEGTPASRGIHVNDIVGIAATSDGKGYWEVASNGTIYAFGDAKSHGDLPAKGIHVTDIVAIDSPSSGGYWLVGSNGAVYAFGNLKSEGSCAAASAACHGVTNVVGIASPDAGGYWLVTSNGRVFPFGDVQSHGSCVSGGSACHGVTDIVGIASPGSDNGGYWLAGANGALYAFGDAENFGNETQASTHSHLTRPIVAITG